MAHTPIYPGRRRIDALLAWLEPKRPPRVGPSLLWRLVLLLGAIALWYSAVILVYGPIKL